MGWKTKENYQPSVRNGMVPGVRRAIARQRTKLCIVLKGIASLLAVTGASLATVLHACL